MAIGISTDPATLNGEVAAIARAWRDVALESTRLATWLSKQDDATVAAAYNIAAGDVAQLRADVGYFATLAGVYNGTVQQGGTGGTGASTFNFGDALTPWTGPS